MTYKTEAVVLKSFEVKEYDRIYEIFSKEHGRMKVLAQGVRKPTAKLASGLEPITRSEIFLHQGRVFDRVTGVIISDQYGEIKKNLQSLKEAKAAVDLLARLTGEKEPSDKIYDSLVLYLENLNKNHQEEDKNKIIQLCFIWKIIQFNGFEPGLYRCCGCNESLKQQDKFWFIPDAGVACQKCCASMAGRKISINQNLIKTLRIFFEKDCRIASKLILAKNDLMQLRQITRLAVENIPSGSLPIAI